VVLKEKPLSLILSPKRERAITKKKKN